jgi:aminoglycoside phosphotransferase (APT) family kinase protein
VDIDGRPGIVFERIEGVSMWDHMKESPWEMLRLTEELVGLQAEVHLTPPIVGLPDVETRVRTKISEVVELPAEERRIALELFEALPTDTALCHGDMHPRNVIMSPRGMVIVDWFDAAVGPRVADFVRSSLLIRPPSCVDVAVLHLDGATRDFLDRLHDVYLEVLTKRRLLDGTDFAAWEAVLAVARMAEPVPKDDLVHVWQSWRNGATRAASPATTPPTGA